MKENVSVKLLAGKKLGAGESVHLFEELLSGKLSTCRAKTILLLLAKRGESGEEVFGCLRVLRRQEGLITVPRADLIDVCGTGGDGLGTFNISTLAALVMAGAGARVAKHGNRSLSSKCGSSDLIESLGVCLEARREAMVRAIAEGGIGYFHAPYYHSAFARIQPLRRQIAVRTLFNYLGPLMNPCRLRYQLAGVSSETLLDLYAAIFLKQGLRRALVCRGRDGIDEISTTVITDVRLVENGKIRKMTIDPKALGFRSPRNRIHYRGSTPGKNRLIALRLLKGGEKGPLRDIVVLNAAAGLWVCGLAKNLKDGLPIAAQSIDCGKAYQSLKILVQHSRFHRAGRRRLI
jgi:anthranilate phosphoribosyltransferase